MPDGFCVPDAGAKYSSAHAVIGARDTAEHVAADISGLDAAGTVTASASAATGAVGMRTRRR